MTGLVIGLTLIAVTLVMFFVALPRQDRKVRPFLRADFAQGIYAVAIVGLGATGFITSVVSLAGAAD
ncbi:hypothetical protein MKI84_02430 [Ancylobacter sp. A5.8]|uniref:hypothetical protein n=1 Tax=Ancylobacter gelatini TaxID=2919920 RepID=UPI001F4E0D6A|nr:hypothetical protein [Ancylobacter gelatini]MCJ8141763.1 hypothetical protein [Ancylobacter gelatini]